ncbi:MAG TPA: aminodeoxychorismate synthase component I [Bacteroidales bacterium]|nr:aminodeoxychorismate synthase component I [Bacteroidales bacterium]
MVFSKSDAIVHMNHLGKLGCPFFFMVDFEMEAIRILELTCQLADISFQSPSFQWGRSDHVISKTLDFNSTPISMEDYNTLFKKVMTEINRGNSFLVNLTVPTPIACNFSLFELFIHAKAKYKLWVKDEFVMFSPETFVTIQDGVISSYPMKGTIRDSSPDSAQTILNNPKEIAEHHTIVDLIRNDLSMVASNVEVTKFRYIDTIQTHNGRLLQVSSEIMGSLPTNYPEHIGDILFTLLPAGSISGAPKAKTLEIIRNVEKQKRGYYTGICGIFDGKNMDSAVMIRFIESKNNGFQFRSGGGITFQSEAIHEYNELIDKVYVPIA